MKAISISSPWWWFILHGGKDIENRDWRTHYRGRVLVHASTWWRTIEILQILSEFTPAWCAPSVSMSTLRPNVGHIVGAVDIVDCVDRHDSPWFFGRHGFVLANPQAFDTPIPCKGALGLFNVPSSILAAAANMDDGTSAF